MGATLILPFFPGYVKSNPNSTIRAYNHKVYADLPSEILEFYVNTLRDLWSGKSVNVKSAWKSLLNNNPHYIIKGVPICSFFETTINFVPNQKSNKAIGFRVNKSSLETYLERNSSSILDDCITNSSMGPLWSTLATNFIGLNSVVTRYNPDELKKASRWELKTSPDYGEIENEIMRLREILFPIDQVLPSYQFYTDLQNLQYSVERLVIQSAYLLIRNLLEKIVITLTIFKIAGEIIDRGFVSSKNEKINLLISIHTLYYENLRRINFGREHSNSCRKGVSVDKFIKEFSDKILKKGIIESNGIINDTVLESFYKNPNSCLPYIHFGKDVAESLSRILDVPEKNIGAAYGMCSSYVHDLLPYPYDSLLELKTFKKFLNFFNTTIEKIMYNSPLLSYYDYFPNYKIETWNEPSSSNIGQFFNENKSTILKLVKQDLKNIQKKNVQTVNTLGYSVNGLFSILNVMQPGISRFNKKKFDITMLLILSSGLQEYSYFPSLKHMVSEAMKHYNELFRKNKGLFINADSIKFNLNDALYLIYEVSQYRAKWSL